MKIKTFDQAVIVLAPAAIVTGVPGLTAVILTLDKTNPQDQASSPRPPVSNHLTCDSALRHELVSQHGALKQEHFNELVEYVLRTRTDCRARGRQPQAINTQHPGMCGEHLLDHPAAAEHLLPKSLLNTPGLNAPEPKAASRSHRDGQTNILIHWANTRRLSGNTNCWTYQANTQTWAFE